MTALLALLTLLAQALAAGPPTDAQLLASRTPDDVDVDLAGEFLALADCESGRWDRHGDPIPGTARWDLPPGEHVFEGGLQFHPDTWDWLRDPTMPDSAHDATRAEQVTVAARVLQRQGWAAWPVCSRKIGLRA